MYVIIKSDGDIDYTSVFGLFGTIEEAEKVIPEDDPNFTYRVVPLKEPLQLDFTAWLRAKRDAERNGVANI